MVPLYEQRSGPDAFWWDGDGNYSDTRINDMYFCFSFRANSVELTQNKKNLTPSLVSWLIFSIIIQRSLLIESGYATRFISIVGLFPCYSILISSPDVETQEKQQ